MKGVVPATLLAALDAKLKAQNKPGVASCFDLFAGTSTGCIIAGALASAPVVETFGGRRYDSPSDILRIYREKGPSIFQPHSALIERLTKNPIDWWGQSYSSKGKEQAFLEAFGRTRLGDLNRNFVATFYEMSPEPRAVIAAAGPMFRKTGDAEYDRFYLRDIVNASSAAPIFFNPAAIDENKVLAVDGGIFANNPAAAAYFAAASLVEPERVAGIEIVSFGCGGVRVKYPKEIGTWGPVEWIKPEQGVPLLNLVSDSQASAIDRQLKSFLGSRYDRFQPPLSEVVGTKGQRLGRMDDGRAENLDALQRIAQAYIDTPEVDARLTALAKRL